MNESIKVIAEFVDNASSGLKAATDGIKEFYAGLAEGAKAELGAVAANNKYNESVEKTAPTAMSAAAGIAMLAAQVFAAKQVFDAFVLSVREADKLDDLSDKTGIAAADLKGLGFAAQQSGSSLEGLVGAFDRLSRSATMSSEDVKKQSETFDQLGVSATDANGQVKDSETLFNELADAFAGIEDGPEKSAAAFRLFGSEAKNLLPLLNKGSAGIRELREESVALGGLSEEQFNAFAAASGNLFDGIDKLVLIFNGLFDTLSSAVVPVLNVIVEQLIESGKEGGMLRDVINGLSAVFNNALVPGLKIGAVILNAFTSTVKIAAKGLGALGAALAALVTGNFSGASAIMSAYKDDVGNIAAEHVKFADKMALAGTESVKLADNLEKPKRKIQGLKKEAKEVTSELEKMIAGFKASNSTFGMDETEKSKFEAQSKYYKDIKVLGERRAAELYKEALAQIELSRALREGKDAQDAYTKAQVGLDAMREANAEIAFEISLVGRSAEERSRLIELRKEELRIQLLQKGLTAEAAASIAAEGQAALLAREGLIKAREEAALTNEVLAGSFDAIQADLQRRIDVAKGLLEAGKITVDDYTKYVNKQLDGFKEKSRADLTEVQQFWADAGSGIQSNLQTFLFDFAQGKLSNLADSFKKTIDQIVANILAAKIATALFGTDFSKGNVGGFVGAGLNSLFGGARAEGGDVVAGKTYLVGEKGPEPFIPEKGGKPMLVGKDGPEPFTPKTNGLILPNSDLNSFFGARAAGGDVIAGKTYLVGEKGPEPFIPKTNGTILPNSVLNSGGSNISISVSAIDSKDFLTKMAEVKREVADMMNNTNRTYRLKGAY